MSPDLPSVTVTSPPDATRTGPGVPPPSPGPPPDAPPGFTLDREIGSGGMGVVYLARQQGLNRPVALKTVRPGTTLDPRALIRFLAEAEAIASIRHPNVVEVYSFGEHAGRPYLALEYCPGGDLTTVSKADQTRDTGWFRRTADLMAKIADGVNAAHALGIVHRDLKPANVLLAADGTPKVTDFGLAKKGLGSDLTQTTDVLGTPAYMAPEQASGRTKFVGPEADVWALGVMLYELLSGTRPFDAPTPLQIMAAVAKADVPKVRDRFPTIPADLALVTHKCLSADPRDRYPTAGPLATDLRNWLDGKPVSARPSGVVESAVKWVQRNKRATLTGAGVLLTMSTATAVSFGFGIDATLQRKKADEEKQAAVDARKEAEAANAKTERALARALLARYATLRYANTDASGNAIHWELMDSRRSDFGRVLIEELVVYPVTSNDEDFISAPLVHAVVGLDAKRRRLHATAMTERIRDSNTPAAQKNCLLIAAARHDCWDGSPTDLIDRLKGLGGGSAVSINSFPRVEALAEAAFRHERRASEVAEVMVERFRLLDTYSQWYIEVQEFCRILPLLSSEQAVSLVDRVVDEGDKRFKRASGYEKGGVASGLVMLAANMPAADGKKLLAEVVAVMANEFNLGRSIDDRQNAAEVVVKSCPQLSRSRAAELAALLLPPLLKDLDENPQSAFWIGTNIRKLCRWLPPERRRETAERLIRKFSTNLAVEKDPFRHGYATSDLVEATALLPEDEAAEVLATAMKTALDDYERLLIEQGQARFGKPPTSVEEATRAAESLAEVDFSWVTDSNRDLPHALESLCLGLTREELHRRKALPALASGLVPPDTLPKPKPLPPQVLVDLLKRPFVVGPQRRAVLNALEFTYDRKFKDLWEFVAFAEKEHPELDLLTPPKRPEKALPKADAKPK